MKIPHLEDLLPLNYEEAIREFEKYRDKVDPKVGRIICLYIARHFKQDSQIDGIREDAKKAADYFLQAAVGYEMQYKIQKNENTEK